MTNREKFLEEICVNISNLSYSELDILTEEIFTLKAKRREEEKAELIKAFNLAFNNLKEKGYNFYVECTDCWKEFELCLEDIDIY